MYSGQQQQQHQQQHQQYYSSSSAHLGATFAPGGLDDFSMPELVSPSPQRSAPEEFHEIQGKLQHMELGADTVRPTSVQGSVYGLADTLGTPGARGGTPQHAPAGGSAGYGAPTYDAGPSFSPFPKLNPRPPNVPPSDDEKLTILDTARAKVIASNDPEIQLTWAQDTLNFVEIAAQDEARNALDGPRPTTPRLEHELKQEALAIIGFLADQSHPRAVFIKGMWLEFGKFGTRKDLRESYRCYARAAERGYARAEYRMGMQFEGSNDIQKAIQHYQTGVQRRDAASSYRMGMMTLMGQHGQVLDSQRGIELIRYSADNADENSPQGAFIYGMLLARELPQVSVPDHVLPPDQNQARMYVEKAAFLGFAKAQTKLGRAYEHSELGCRFDATLSLHYNNLAARQGDEDAEMAISKWFLSGQEGIFAKNEQMAFNYAKRAAKSGLSTAEFAMGYFHEVGIHVPVDLKEAQRWYRKAADSGNKDAAARVEGISRSKTLSRKDHDRIAVAKVREGRAGDQGEPPRTSSRAGGPNGAPLQMPQPTGTPANGGYQSYQSAGSVYPPAAAQYPPAGSAYPPAGAAYPPAGAAYQAAPQNAPGTYPPHGQNQYGAYGKGPAPGPGAAGGRPSPAPGPGGYGSPVPGGQGPGQRPPYQNNPGSQYPPRSTSTPQQAGNRRPGQGPPGPVQSPQADFGYAAPPANYKPRPDYMSTGQYPTPTSRPDHPSNPPSPVSGPRTSLGSGRGAPQQQKPIQQRQPSQPQPPRQPSLPQQQPQQPPSAAQRKPQKPMVQGPSTFDEMGVPKVKDKEDCIVM